jgi:Zn-dependent peptidase ImmA (M78 family)
VTGFRHLSNFVEFVEDKGIKVLMVDFYKSFEGLSAWVNDNEFPVVVINRNMSVERIRFTAMHELGHLLLNIPSELPDKEKEKICHRFANAMLLPKEALFEEVGNKRRGIALPELIAIKEQYGISVAAVLMRMRDLGIINNSYYKNFYISHISKDRQEEKLGGYKGVEESNRFMMLLNRAVAEEVVTMSRAAELSNVKLATFRSEYLSI